MTTDRMSATTGLIIALLVANLGLSAYIAFRPSPVSAVVPLKESAPDITNDEARKLSETLVPLYNQKNFSALYDQFEPLAKLQFTKQQLEEQIEKLSSLIGKIDQCVYSHATFLATREGRTYYTLHYKVSLSGGSLSTGNMTLNVARNANGLGLFGFFINGGISPGGQ